jgi:SAM-dependent methyltransferase
MVRSLGIGSDDAVVEFAPGLGLTAKLILACQPASYVGVERDQDAARWVGHRLPSRPNVGVRVGTGSNTGLPDGTASIVLGEAMLSMHTTAQKAAIIGEAFRLLQPGGRYGLHEMSLVPDGMAPDLQAEIERSLSSAIHVGARPLGKKEWVDLLEQGGFHVVHVHERPMDLLRPTRLVEDEGLLGALRFLKNVLTDRPARRRVLEMRRTFERYRSSLGAICLIAERRA